MPRPPKPQRKPRPSPERRRPRDEKPRTKMTRTATQARAEAVIEEKKRRSQEQEVREEDESGSLGTFEDYQADEDETSVKPEEGADDDVAVDVAGEPEFEQARPTGRLPIVAIVGRPNVGKSSLFNKLAGSRIAIEDPRPGTTRDRVSAIVGFRETEQRVVELYDTAGIGIVDEKQVEDHVHEQIEYGIARADVVLFVVDAKDGLTTLDTITAEKLRRTGHKVLLVANKADAPHQDAMATAFYELGLGDPIAISAKEGRNIKQLKRALTAALPPHSDAERLEAPELLLAIVGRRNAGKSSIVNALANDKRVIVSEMAGTTRDSVDVRFEFEGKSFVAIDTAGIRRKQSFENSVDFFSQSRALRAVRRASVVVLLMDAREPVTRLERELIELAMRENKPIIIGINKWDLITKPTDKFVDYIKRKLGEIDFAPVVFLSAKTGLNVFELVKIARELHEQAGLRIGTGELNRIVNAAYEKHHPQPRKNKLGRLFYATQASIYPPTVVVFVNDPELFPEAWRRYLLRELQAHTPYGEVPIRIKLKARERIILDRS
ncbi:GTPase Der [Planctomycetaceae bacterium]|nr:GTPase Der [Planctomycetaceae bacterium]